MIDTLGRDELFDALQYMECDSDDPIPLPVWYYNWNKEGAIHISPTGNITVDVSFPHYTRTVHYRRTILTDLYLTFKAIKKPHNWTQGAATSRNGEMCLIEASRRITNAKNLDYGTGDIRYDAMLDALYETLLETGEPLPGPHKDLVLADFNDNSTHSLVIDLIQTTINRLKEEV